MTDANNALLLRDADGEVYFLGHEDLQNYRLTGDRAAAANASLDRAEDEDVEAFSWRGDEAAPALHGSDFKSIVYAPVMKGHTFETATVDAFVADSPPDGAVSNGPSTDER